LLKEAVPEIQRVAILSNPANPSNELALRDVSGAARLLRLQLQLLEARGPEDFEGAFVAAASEHAQALFVVADSMFFIHRIRLADLAERNRLPSMYGNREAAEAGGLMSYGADFASQFRQAAVYVNKILKGAKPADLPVEQPEKFELVINLKTAKAIGIAVPPTLLARADEVIE
jgi:putative ABC transport system substrate-binding protein